MPAVSVVAKVIALGTVVHRIVQPNALQNVLVVRVLAPTPVRAKAAAAAAEMGDVLAV